MKFQKCLLMMLLIFGISLNEGYAVNPAQTTVVPGFIDISNVAVAMVQQVQRTRILAYYSFFYGAVKPDPDIVCPIGVNIAQNHWGNILLAMGWGLVPQCPQLPDSTDIGIGDLNGDNLKDIITVGNGSSSVWLNNGRQGFTDSGQSFNNANSTGMVLMDLDNDGDLDLVVGNFNQPKQIFQNDGFGEFTRLSGDRQTFGLTSGLDDDHPTTGMVRLNDDQFIETRYSEADILWTRTPGTDQFTASEIDADNTQSTGICVDEAENGDQTIVITRFEQKNSIYFMDERAIPVIVTDDGEMDKTQGCHFGDLNDDGFKDIIFANYGEKNSILINDGSDKYQRFSLDSSSNTTVLFPADFDKDGQLDLIEARDVEPGESVLKPWNNITYQTPQARLSGETQYGDEKLNLKLDLNCQDKKDQSADYFLLAQQVDQSDFYYLSLQDFQWHPGISPTLANTPCATINHLSLSLPLSASQFNAENYNVYFGLDFTANSQLDVDSSLYFDAATFSRSSVSAGEDGVAFSGAAVNDGRLPANFNPLSPGVASHPVSGGLGSDLVNIRWELNRNGQLTILDVLSKSGLPSAASNINFGVANSNGDEIIKCFVIDFSASGVPGVTIAEDHVQFNGANLICGEQNPTVNSVTGNLIYSPL